MNENEFNSHLKKLGELSNQLAEKKHAWFQQILLASSTLFGILVSFQNKPSNVLSIRLSFGIAVALLGFGILLTGISLYSHLDAVDRVRKAYLKKSQNELHGHSDTKHVSVPERRIFLICEKLSYICFFLSVFSISLYSVLLMFL